MYHFYVENSNIFEQEIRITGADVKHMKQVLRMKPGEKIIICNGQGKDYYSIIDRIEEQEIIARIEKIRETESELSTKLILFQGIPKKDKMEFVIQKAVELGVYEIVPMLTKRTIVKLEEKKKEQKKIERWSEIAKSAAKQSGRGWIPRITEPLSFREALKKASSLDAAMVPYEAEEGIVAAREYVSGLKGLSTVGILIGPEGGFEEEEIALAKQFGIRPITLGKRILRTETAGLAVLSILMFALEEEEREQNGDLL